MSKPDIWRIKPGALTDKGGETWDVYCGDEHMGTEFESQDEAEDFIREHLDEGWSTDWPGAEGWYWFWDPGFPELVEPAQMRFFGHKGEYVMYSRSSEMIYKKDFPGCHWHVMEKPPPAPPHESGAAK